MISIDKRLEGWMIRFYNWSSDEDNKDSKLRAEFKELKKIIKEIKELEGKRKYWEKKFKKLSAEEGGSK